MPLPKQEENKNLERSRKLLVVAYYFPPLGGAGVQRTLKFVKYLGSFHWQPTVFTVRKAYHLSYDPALLAEVPASARLVATPAFLPGRFFRRLFAEKGRGPAETGAAPPGNHRLFGLLKGLFYTFFFIPDEFVGWVPFAVWWGARRHRRERFQALFTTAPPNSVHLTGLFLKRLTGLPWVADFRDLWDQYPHSYNPFGFSWRTRLDARLERLVVRNADHILVISATMREQLLRKFPGLSPARVTVLPNGFDPEDFDGVPARGTGGPEGRCQILHTGTVYPWRKTAPLFAALRAVLDKNPAFRKTFRLRFLGAVHRGVVEEIAHHRLEDVVDILPPQPYHEALGRLAQADFALLIVGDLPQNANALALKLFDYIGAGCPVLVLGPEGEAQRLVQDAEIGWWAPSEDPGAIAGLLWRACTSSAEIREQLRKNIVQLQARFDRKQLTRRLAAVLNRLTGGFSENG